MLVSLALPVVGNYIGRAGDCKPGEIDGQCGLGTFIGLLYGLCAAVVVAGGVSVYTVFALLGLRRRERSRQKTEHLDS